MLASAWEQAPVVFAPQKGADQAAGARARRCGSIDLADELPQDPRGKLMTGAGGGLAGGLWSACGAQLKGGAALVLDQVDFPARMRASRAVITGEGSLDRQTLLGKAVGEVATRARQGGVPCHAIVGRMEMTEFDARILDFESVTEAGLRRSDRRRRRTPGRSPRAVLGCVASGDRRPPRRRRCRGWPR